MPQKFMPRSPYAPRHTTYFSSQYARKLRSTKLLRASTRMVKADSWHRRISIHEALTSLDILKLRQNLQRSNFDPRGSCEPRLLCTTGNPQFRKYFDPRGSCEPRRHLDFGAERGAGISIHEALASLDIPVFSRNKLRLISIHEALASLDPFCHQLHT